MPELPPPQHRAPLPHEISVRRKSDIRPCSFSRLPRESSLAAVFGRRRPAMRGSALKVGKHSYRPWSIFFFVFVCLYFYEWHALGLVCKESPRSIFFCEWHTLGLVCKLPRSIFSYEWHIFGVVCKLSRSIFPFFFFGLFIYLWMTYTAWLVRSGPGLLFCFCLFVFLGMANTWLGL